MQYDFVIQLRPEGGPDRNVFRGRLEHIDSGRSGHFDSLSEFFDLLVRLSASSQPARQSHLNGE